jgi:predicted negative regulator of RcsB-dependent stress response
MTERDQWDALKTWLKENGAWIVAGVVLGVAVLAGWRYWQDRVTTRAQTAAARYNDVIAALDANDAGRAVELTDQLRKEYSDTPYVDQSDLALAREYVETGDMDAAAARLRSVMANSDDDELRHVATLRLARVQIAQGKPDDALATLGPSSDSAFDPRYAEVRGDALVAKGDTRGALAEYRKAQGGKDGAAVESGLVDQGLLQLKINDLAVSGEATAQTQDPPK